MKKSTRALLATSALLIIASFGTCYFGVKHAVNQIPHEQFVRMADTDWIGSEWIERGMYVFILAGLVGLAAVFSAIVNRAKV